MVWFSLVALLLGIWAIFAGGTIQWLGWGLVAAAAISGILKPPPSSRSQPPEESQAKPRLTLGPYELLEWAPREMATLATDSTTRTSRAVGRTGPLAGQTVMVTYVRQYSEPDLDLEGIRKEIELQQTLDHPAIPRLLDFGEGRVDTGGPLTSYDTFYKVEPAYPGEPLLCRLDKREPVPLEQARNLARDIGGALVYLHERGLVHGNLRPESVWLGDEQSYLMDFPHRKRHVRLIGGVWNESHQYRSLYAAPELWGEGKPGPASDQFSLGSMIFQSLTGQGIFEGVHAKNAREYAVSGATLRKLRDLRPECPVSMEKALARMLAHDPGERFPTMEAALEALEEGFVAAGVGNG